VQTVLIDPFPPGMGDFVINGGALSSLLPNLDLSITTPPNARAMAIFEGDLPDASTPAWMELSNHYQWNVRGAGPKTIHVRFLAFDGTISPVISRTIFFDPFPYGAESLAINGGQPSTNSSLVTVSLAATVNVLSYRLAESLEALEDLPFSEFVPTLTYNLSTSPGLHRLYVQYRTATGEVSPAYAASIQLTP
jgi:hypothetical protein